MLNIEIDFKILESFYKSFWFQYLRIDEKYMSIHFKILKSIFKVLL